MATLVEGRLESTTRKMIFLSTLVPDITVSFYTPGLRKAATVFTCTYTTVR